MYFFPSANEISVIEEHHTPIGRPCENSDRDDAKERKNAPRNLGFFEGHFSIFTTPNATGR